MKPSLGRIVIYRTSEHDPLHNSALELPAIIVRVWSDTCVNLKVINDEAADFWRTSCFLDESRSIPQNWHWPERIT